MAGEKDVRVFLDLSLTSVLELNHDAEEVTLKGKRKENVHVNQLENLDLEI